jgi:dephospho-CoA kinase
MKKLALTGNIGSGKSYVADVLRKMGFPVYEADKNAHRFLSSPDVIMKIADRFGLETLTPDGLPDRKKIAAIVFANPEALLWLNRTIHPLVMRDFNQWVGKQTGSNACFLESAIIFENNLQHHFDAVIFVDAPLETAIQRVMERDQATRDHVLARMQNQWPAEQKRTLADFVIINDNQQMITPQIIKALSTLI